jgi:hypothetical protein
MKRAGPTAADDEELIMMPPVTSTKSKAGPGHANMSATPYPGSRPYSREDFGEQYGQQYAAYGKKRKANEAVLGNAFMGPRRQQEGSLLEDDDINPHAARHHRPAPLNDDTETVEVSRGQLNSAMKSKLDIYRILAIEGQMYLPPFKDCTMDFLKGVINGSKKVGLRDLTL